MVNEQLLESYIAALLDGQRAGCRAIVEKVLQTGTPANVVYMEVIWPMMVEIEQLLRAGRITPVQEHMATRINRAIADQLQNKLPRKGVRGKKVVVCCAQDQLQEVGAQIMADLFESDGWDVKLLGGGLTNDDLLGFVNEYGPDVLLVYGATAKQAPGVRELIDRVREINAWPSMRVMVSGGLFNRAEGLWEEIGADLFAASAAQAVEVALSGQTLVVQDEDTQMNAPRKRRKKRVNRLPVESVN